MAAYGRGLSRRGLLAGVTGIASAAITGAGPSWSAEPSGPGVAVTIDDFDLGDDPLTKGWDRDVTIRGALAARSMKAAVFPSGMAFGGDIADAVLSAWSDEGHVIGNHSWSHEHVGEDSAAYMADILRQEEKLAGYPRFEKLFRYPYLDEGQTASARDGIRAQLREHGYRIAPVTIDSADWYVDIRLRRRLEAEPEADLEPYRKFYLDHVWSRATHYDGLSKQLYGRSIDHTILMHHLLTTRLFLADVLAMFVERGWRLVDASAALAQPELNVSYDTLPAGQSLLRAAGKARGWDEQLRPPAEDGAYDPSAMDAMGL